MFRFENKPSSRIMLEKNRIVVCQEKNSITRGLGKKSYPNKITHTPPQKSNGRFPIFITLDTDCLYEKKSLQMKLV